MYGATGLFLHFCCDYDRSWYYNFTSCDNSCDNSFIFILSQGSVSIILTLVYPCCGIWQNEGQNVFAYPTFLYCILSTYLNSCPGRIHVFIHVSFLTRMHEDMLFHRGECVTHWKFRYFRRIGDIGKLAQYDLL